MFFAQMQLDMELEEKIKQFVEEEKLTVKVQREFIVEVKDNGKESNNREIE